MTQPSIVIVEDEAVVAEDLSEKLKALGYRVLDVVSAGEAALETIQAHVPDLILLDIQLAGTLDGTETATRIRESFAIPVIFLTAHSDPETVKRATTAGCAGYVLKPFRERDLQVQLQAALFTAEQKRTQQKLRTMEDLLLRAQRGAQAGVWEIDLRSEKVTWSSPYYDLFGIPRSTKPSLAAWLSCIHPEDRERVLAAYRQSITDPCNQNMEFRIVKPDGDIRWIQRQGQVERDEDGKPIRINGISFDITERKHADEVLKSIALFPAQNPSPVLRISGAGILLYLNPVSHELLRDLKLEVGRAVPMDLDTVVKHSLKANASQQTEYALRSSHYLITVTPVVDAEYANLYWTDITERKRAEEALRSSEQRARAFLDNSAIIAWLKDEEGRNVFLSENYVRRFGLKDWKDKTDFQLWPPDIAEAFRDNDLMVLAREQPVEVIEQTRMADGSVSFWLNSKFWFQDASGRKFVGGVGVDITEREKAEEALRDSEERLRLSNLATNEVIWDWNVASDRVVWNDNAVTLFGWSEAVESPRTAAWWLERVHPEDRTRVAAHFFTAVNDPAVVSWADEYRFQKHDGTYAYVLDRGYSIRDASGKPVRMLGTMLDITEKKDAQVRLWHFTEELEQQVKARTAELLQTQDQLRALATELNLAEQRERKRLATELHDHLQQTLVVAKLKLGQGKRLADAVPAAAKSIREADETLSEALQYTRTLVVELSPPVLRDHGLAAGLQWLGEYMKKHDFTVTMTMSEGARLDLPEDQSILIFQSVRELLINASKHAGTHEAWITIQEGEDTLVIEVRDTGAGFDLAARPGTADSPRGELSSKFGLLSIRERMKALGGAFEIHSMPGKGTTATLTLPVLMRRRSPNGDTVAHTGTASSMVRERVGAHSDSLSSQTALPFKGL